MICSPMCCANYLYAPSHFTKCSEEAPNQLMQVGIVARAAAQCTHQPNLNHCAQAPGELMRTD